MAAKLDDETKRLRALKDGELADAVGALKAQAAATGQQIDAAKAEAVRRDLRNADGKLFRITLSPPGEQSRIDKTLIESVFGAPFVTHFSKISATDWILRCTSLKRD